MTRVRICTPRVLQSPPRNTKFNPTPPIFVDRPHLGSHRSRVDYNAGPAAPDLTMPTTGRMLILSGMRHRGRAEAVGVVSILQAYKMPFAAALVLMDRAAACNPHRR